MESMENMSCCNNTRRLSNVATENPLSIEVSIEKSLINGPFSMATFDYQRVRVGKLASGETGFVECGVKQGRTQGRIL